MKVVWIIPFFALPAISGVYLEDKGTDVLIQFDRVVVSVFTRGSCSACMGSLTVDIDGGTVIGFVSDSFSGNSSGPIPTKKNGGNQEARIDLTHYISISGDPCGDIEAFSSHTVSATLCLPGNRSLVTDESNGFDRDDCGGCTEVLQKAGKSIGSNPCDHSPLVFDLGRDGFTFSGPDQSVFFDLYGSGSPLNIQWVTPNSNDAFLVHDANGNGVVDNGNELFGNGTTLLSTGEKAPNGFVALGEFDDPEHGGDGDGYISHRDGVWPELLLWLDGNADGISTENEMIPLEEVGLEWIQYTPRELDSYDHHRNWLRYWAGARAGSPLHVIDVFFKSVP
ncbi:MAG: hypothetical protein QNK37_23230 [Acidobacteriota bacterium]|nr:hypothetical protein [Acidobacteriota bacterium]